MTLSVSSPAFMRTTTSTEKNENVAVLVDWGMSRVTGSGLSHMLMAWWLKKKVPVVEKVWFLAVRNRQKFSAETKDVKHHQKHDYDHGHVACHVHPLGVSEGIWAIDTPGTAHVVILANCPRSYIVQMMTKMA